MKQIKIGNRILGEGCKTFIIAEAGVNHNGSVDMAKKLIDVAKKVGADAIKFQTFKTEEVITESAPKAKYQTKYAPECTQYEMIKGLELSDDIFMELAEYAKKIGIIFLSSPFDKESVDLLEKIGIPAFKIGSGEITNIPLLEYVSKKGKPIILSTGMASICEIEEAINSIKYENEDLILMYCVTNYPAKFDDVDLNVIKTLKSTFKFLVGFSDHTMGIEIAVASVASGSCVIEKHITLDRNLEGPDHKASLEPNEFKNLVHSIRNLEAALGDGRKIIKAEEKEIKKVARKSIVSKAYIPKGNILKKEDLCIKRPGNGIKPKYLDFLIGKKAKFDIKKDEILKWDKIT